MSNFHLIGFLVWIEYIKIYKINGSNYAFYNRFSHKHRILFKLSIFGLQANYSYYFNYYVHQFL